MLTPGFGAQPGAASELPLEEIAAELVAALLVQPAEAAAQIGRHVLGVPAREQDVAGRLDPERERLFGDSVTPRDEERNLIAAEAVLQNAAVVLEAAHRHRDVTPAAALLPHGTQDLGRGGFALDARVLRLKKADAAVRRLGGRRGVVKQMVREIRQGALPLPQVHRLLADLRPGGLGRLAQRLQRQAGGQEEFLVVSLRGRQADGQLLPPPQQRAEDFRLEPGEVDEAVDIDPVKLREAEALQLPREQGQRLFLRRAGALRDRVIGIQNQRQFLQLPAELPVQFLRKLPQERAVGGRGAEGFRLPQDQLLQVDVIRRPAEKAQHGLKLLQGGSHAEQAPGPVQAHLGAPAVLPHAPAGQAAEAHDLGIQREPVAAGLTELPLGLVAVLFRNKQQRARRPRSDRVPDLPDDEGGLSAADFSCDQSQTHTQLPFFDDSIPFTLDKRGENDII